MPSLLLDLAIKNDGIVCVPNIVPKVADDALVTPVHVRVGQDGDFGIFPADGLLCLTLRCARSNVKSVLFVVSWMQDCSKSIYCSE